MSKYLKQELKFYIQLGEKHKAINKHIIFFLIKIYIINKYY